MATMQMQFLSTSLNRLVSMTGVIPIENSPRMENPKPEKFPALYLLHGYSGICTDWLYGTRIQKLADRFNIAIFCPSGENSFYVNDVIGKCFYADFIGKELVEFTRKMFPISDKFEDTLIAGLSMGGYGAIRNGLFYDDTFGGIFAFSSALITDTVTKMKPDEVNPMGHTADYYARLFGPLDKVIGSDNDPKTLATRAVEKNGKLPKLYMACGTEDFLLNENRDFKNHLSTLACDFTYEEWAGVHDWAFWDVAIEKALAWWVSQGK